MDRLEEINLTLRQLQGVEERYANKEERTGEVRRDLLAHDCAEAIQYLISEVDRLKQGWIDANENHTDDFMRLSAKIVALTARAEAAETQADAAVKDMAEMAKCRLLGTCTFCKHRGTPDARYKPCKGCEQPNGSRLNFEWRGQGAGKGGNNANT